MSLDKIVSETVASIEDSLGRSLTAQQREAITAAIKKSLSETVDQTGKRHSKAATDYLSADADLAHKIADEIRRANVALKANLESLR
jgi:hypothetical protein